MPKNVRDKALLDPFIAKLNVATERRFSSLTELIEHMTFCKERLTENIEKVRGHLDSGRARLHRPRASLFCTWSPHTNKIKVSPIELYLLLDARLDGGAVTKFSLREQSRRTELMTPVLGIRAARQFTKDVDSFFLSADQAVRWINTLPGESPDFLNRPATRSGFDQWITAIGGLTEKASIRATTVVERFLELDTELNDLVFEFNAARQPVRFHSIICRRDCSNLDVLSPAEPKFRVIVHLNRRTGRRSSKDVQAYKQELTKKRLVEKLGKLIGRSPSMAEVEQATSRQRYRLPTQWLTEDLISHCKLGRHSAQIVRHQKMMATVMDEWGALRQTLQALLK